MDKPASDAHSATSHKRLPLRLQLELDDGGVSHERVLKRPFRLGYGEDCDVQLTGGDGPGVVFQVERAKGPLLIAKALPPEECEHYVELKINGEPLRDPVQEIPPGARLDIVEKATQRRYKLVLDPKASPRLLRPRNLAILIAVLVLIGSAFGFYLYSTLRGTQSEVARTSERVEQAAARFERTAETLIDSVRKMGSTDAELERAVRELRALGAETAQRNRDDFTQKLAELNRDTREALDRLAQEDIERREAREREAQKALDALRGEFSTRMVESYRHLKGVEQKLLTTMSERFAQRDDELTHLKKVLAASRSAVLFIRTRYRVEFSNGEEAQELSGFGTGFIVGAEGLAVTAQHVMYPWRYDRDLLALAALDLAKVVPESVRWNVWTTDSNVLLDSTDDQSFNIDESFGSGDAERSVRMLYAPQAQRSTMMIGSPIGVVEVMFPVPGRTDVAVFQLIGVEAPIAYLSLAAAPGSVEALDEVLVLGYPYSRLDGGVASPQAVRGFVRRVSGDLLEIDAAVHPGLSGGPLMDGRGAVVGMVTAIIRSDVYGAAVRSADLGTALREARSRILNEEKRLSELGCDPGNVDGVFDRQTAAAYQCEAKRSP